MRMLYMAPLLVTIMFGPLAGLLAVILIAAGAVMTKGMAGSRELLQETRVSTHGLWAFSMFVAVALANLLFSPLFFAHNDSINDNAIAMVKAASRVENLSDKEKAEYRQSGIALEFICPLVRREDDRNLLLLVLNRGLWGAGEACDALVKVNARQTLHMAARSASQIISEYDQPTPASSFEGDLKEYRGSLVKKGHALSKDYPDAFKPIDAYSTKRKKMSYAATALLGPILQ